MLAEIFNGMNNRIRLLLNVDNSILTNDMIESFNFAGIAKIKIDRIIKLANPTTEQNDIINSCYVYQTALNAIQIIYNDTIKSEKTVHSKVKYNTLKKLQLFETISDRLNQLLIMFDVGIKTQKLTVFSTSNTDNKYEGDVYHRPKDFSHNCFSLQYGF